MWKTIRCGLLATMALGLAVEATAAQDWNPFRDHDETAPPLRRRSAAPAPAGDQAPLAPMTDEATGRGRLASDVGSRFRATEPGEPLRSGDVDASPYARQPSFPAPPTGYASARPSSQSRFPAGASADASRIEHFDLDAPEDRAHERPAPDDHGGTLADAWRGVDIKSIESQFAAVGSPSRSDALQGLWLRLLLAPDTETADGGGNVGGGRLDALRLEALYRAGAVGTMAALLERKPAGEPSFAAVALRRDLALGRRAEACAAAKALAGQRALPIGLVGELRLIAGYCAAVAGDAGGAGVAADLAREEGVDAPVALPALDALAGNDKSGFSPPKVVRVLDYRLLELLGPVDIAQILDKAEPALIAGLAVDDGLDPRARVLAAEAAARIHAVTREQLRAAYDGAPASAEEPALRRAELVRLIAAEQAPARRLQLMTAALADARKDGLLVEMARVLEPLLAPLPANGFAAADARRGAETAIVVLLAAGDTRRAREVVAAAEAWHWLPLVDIAEAGPNEDSRERNLGRLDDLLRRGRLSVDLLNRLATVLDATDVNVPLPLWEAASRAQPTTAGYLPETGLLGQLQEASKRRDVARTILLSLRAMGPVGADGAHIIALGDVIRALRRVGLDADARRLGVEALIAEWPRGSAS